MDKQNTISFETALAALTALGDTRVWSLIVTVMGDRAADGAAVDGSVLAKILHPIGVKPEALRVALHRLRKDGWIISEKSGRTSAHRLTIMGQSETHIAARRIYRRQPAQIAQWYVLCGEEVCSSAPKEAVHLGRGIYLGQGPAPQVDGFLVMQGDAPIVPDWVRSRLGGPELARAYSDLADTLSKVQAALADGGGLPPLQTATLRIMIVHHWRRNLLKHPDFPIGFFPAGWQGEACRGLVLALLDQLERR